MTVVVNQSIRGSRRNWRWALGLSVVPGLGQLYNLQIRKAAFFLLGTTATLVPAVVLLTRGEDVGRWLLERGSAVAFLAVAMASVVTFLALFVLGLFLWASAALDALRIARTSAEDDGAERWWFFRL